MTGNKIKEEDGEGKKKVRNSVRVTFHCLAHLDGKKEFMHTNET